jgi:hypothetical protein
VWTDHHSRTGLESSASRRASPIATAPAPSVGLQSARPRISKTWVMNRTAKVLETKRLRRRASAAVQERVELRDKRTHFAS